MSYQKYSTDALVLRSYERGEADRIFALYTREFGFVWARASAVRRENSRRRYALQSYSRARVSLVRGTRGWRLAGASALQTLQGENTSAIAVFARIAQLVERLIAGEEKNEYLFLSLAEAQAALMSAPSTSHSSIELLGVARVLFSLGYLSPAALGTALFTHTAYSMPSLEEAEAARNKLLSSVNNAIAQSQM